MYYTIVLLLHSWVRWIVLGLGLVATFAAMGAGDAPSNSRAERL